MAYHRQQRSLFEFVMKRKWHWLHIFTWTSNEPTSDHKKKRERKWLNLPIKPRDNMNYNIIRVQTHTHTHRSYTDEISTHTSDADIRGVLLTSYMAIRPSYSFSPALYDRANRSPEASHAIFSMPRLHIIPENIMTVFNTYVFSTLSEFRSTIVCKVQQCKK